MKRYILTDTIPLLDESIRTKRDLAQSPNTRPATLMELAKDLDDGVRANVAGNHNTPLETLNILAVDDSDEVRYWVIRNPNISVGLLETFLHDEYEGIRTVARWLLVNKYHYDVDSGEKG